MLNSYTRMLAIAIDSANRSGGLPPRRAIQPADCHLDGRKTEMNTGLLSGSGQVPSHVQDWVLTGISMQGGRYHGECCT